MSAITLDDLSLRESNSRNHFGFCGIPTFRRSEICTERARLVTRYSIEAGLFERDRITSLDKPACIARCWRTVRPSCGTPRHTNGPRWDAGVCHPGQFSLCRFHHSRFKGVPLYPEFLALGLWPELRTISRRSANPNQLSEEDLRVLNFEVFPRWMHHTITELARVNGTAEDRRRMPAPA